MKNSNQFSLRRLWQLVKMELVMQQRTLPIFSIGSAVICILLPLIVGYGTYDFSKDLYFFIDFGFIHLLIMLAHYILFSYIIRKRVFESDTVAYCTIPSTTAERYISIILIGAIIYCMAWLAAQVTMTTLVLINPSVVHLLDIPHPLIQKLGDFYVYRSTFTINDGLLRLSLLVVAFGFYGSITQKGWGWNGNKLFDKLLFLSMILLFLLDNELQKSGILTESFGKQLMTIYVVIFFVVGYFRLKQVEEI